MTLTFEISHRLRKQTHPKFTQVFKGNKLWSGGFPTLIFGLFFPPSPSPSPSPLYNLDTITVGPAPRAQWCDTPSSVDVQAVHVKYVDVCCCAYRPNGAVDNRWLMGCVDSKERNKPVFAKYRHILVPDAFDPPWQSELDILDGRYAPSTEKMQRQMA